MEYHARDGANPGLDDVLDQIVEATWGAAARSGLAGEVQRAVETRTTEAMLSLAASPGTSLEVAAVVRAHLEGLKVKLSCTEADRRAHCAGNVARIEEFERDPAKFVPAKAVEAPPGCRSGMTRSSRESSSAAQALSRAGLQCTEL